ncbi:hypothetical protein F5X99DRAFT_367077 [Biscogniauxia marginata]|nr:hypothetical protein F5X99DRAFT_367077 [Biscogniauxia marginata]
MFSWKSILLFLSALQWWVMTLRCALGHTAVYKDRTIILALGERPYLFELIRCRSMSFEKPASAWPAYARKIHIKPLELRSQNAFL